MPSTKIPLDIQKLYDCVTDYINVILLSEKTTVLLRKDNEFQNLFSLNVGIVNYLENKYNFKEKNAEHYIKAYYSICGTNIKFDDKNKIYGNLVDMKDTVNYLNVYLYNKIGLNFDSLKDELSSKPNKENLANLDESESKNNNKTEDNASRSQENLSDDEVIRKSGYTIHDVANQLINTQASMLLQRNISKGVVYIYDSKPKIIPILKYLLVFAFLSIFALSIASFAFLLSINGKVNGYNDSQSSTYTISFVSTIPYQQICLLIFVLIICWSIIRNIKNDNFKFFITWGWTIFYLIFLIVIIVSSSETQLLMFNYNTVIQTIENTKANNSASDIKHVETVINNWRIVQYVVYALFGFIASCIITAIIFNPKRDSERINQLLQSYVEGIRNGTIDSNDLNGGNTFGSFGSRFF